MTTPKATLLKDYTVPSFLVETVDLAFDIQPDFTQVTSEVKFVRNSDCKLKPSDLVLVGDGLELISVSLDSKVLTDNQFTVKPDELVVKSVSDNFNLTVKTKVYPEKNTELSGLYYSSGNYCTQCEPQGFRRITYYLDRPDVMAIFTTTIIADRAKYPVLLSNGNCIDKGDVSNNNSGVSRHWVKWQDPHKKPSYLFALVAGDFEKVEDSFRTQSGRDVALKLYVENGQRHKAHFALHALKKAMRWDEIHFGREYDLDIFMIVAVSDFNSGAMENKGLNIFNTKYILASDDTATDFDYQQIDRVIAHEYFHNWTGNRITCRDWFDLCLKEGLTVLREQLYCADQTSSVLKRIEEVNFLRQTQFPEDSGPLSHPVRPESYIEINNFYTATVYEKGSEIFRMLRVILGVEKFRKGMDHYFAKHDGQAITIADFVVAMEEANDVDLKKFHLWYNQSGTPTLDVTGDYDQKAKTYKLTLKQVCSASSKTSEQKLNHRVLETVEEGASSGGDSIINGSVISGDISAVSNNINGVERSSSADQALVIPVKMGLIMPSGESEKFNGTEHTDAILLTDELEKTFLFDDVQERPVPSLLRNFSAPVNLNFDYSDDDLYLLAQHDTDGFNRWEAMQSLYYKVLLQNISKYQNAKGGSLGSVLDSNVDLQDGIDDLFDLPPKLISVINSLLSDDALDKQFLSELLSLPSEKMIAQRMTVVDVDAIHFVREWVLSQIGIALKSQLQEVYTKYNSRQGAYVFNNAAVGERSLKHTALLYLVKSGDASAIKLAVKHFETANNMTDCFGALQLLVNEDCPERDIVLAAFYTKFADDQLVINKWLRIQATSTVPSALSSIKQLADSSAFSIKNPNNVYSLVYAFAEGNPVHFHAADGSGYEFFADQVMAVDALNAQVAARIAKSIASWRSYDEARQGLIKKQLERILAGDISNHLYEVVNTAYTGESNG